MTRNEMVNKLSDFLRENLWGKDSYELSDSILWFLEDEGMRPPEELFHDIDRDGKRRINQRNGDYVAHWETEEEIAWKKKNVR